jgi:hypothetical protein
LDKMNTLKRKVAKVKSQTKTHIHRSNNFVTLSQGFTNLTTRKRKYSRGNYSRQNAINEHKDMESFQIESCSRPNLGGVSQ